MGLVACEVRSMLFGPDAAETDKRRAVLKSFPQLHKTKKVQIELKWATKMHKGEVLPTMLWPHPPSWDVVVELFVREWRDQGLCLLPSSTTCRDPLLTTPRRGVVIQRDGFLRLPAHALNTLRPPSINLSGTDTLSSRWYNSSLRVMPKTGALTSSVVRDVASLRAESTLCFHFHPPAAYALIKHVESPPVAESSPCSHIRAHDLLGRPSASRDNSRTHITNINMGGGRCRRVWRTAHAQGIGGRGGAGEGARVNYTINAKRVNMTNNIVAVIVLLFYDPY
ncbi:hypothetical protein K438DRAFT_1776411 [Mycena galopus ATCC 62051]|nr:hypothetical protein K438DRAFT_1776411 [Mycena galopus ATCC 62051]